MSVGTELAAVPFPMMVKNLGVGIAEAQLELDMVSLKIARMMAGYEIEEVDEVAGQPTTANAAAGDAERKYLGELSDGEEDSLLERGLTPTFYQFVDTVIELKISISTQTETSRTHKSTRVKAGFKGAALPFFAAGSMSVSSVSASFASKYQYSAEGSSVMRTKLVPVPAPALLEERIRAMIAARAAAEN